MIQLIEFTTDRLYLRQWQDRDRIPFAESNIHTVGWAKFGTISIKKEG
jgi:hypothetical protein